MRKMQLCLVICSYPVNCQPMYWTKVSRNPLPLDRRNSIAFCRCNILSVTLKHYRERMKSFSLPLLRGLQREISS